MGTGLTRGLCLLGSVVALATIALYGVTTEQSENRGVDDRSVARIARRYAPGQIDTLEGVLD